MLQGRAVPLARRATACSALPALPPWSPGGPRRRPALHRHLLRRPRRQAAQRAPAARPGPLPAARRAGAARRGVVRSPAPAGTGAAVRGPRVLAEPRAGTGKGEGMDTEGSGGGPPVEERQAPAGFSPRTRSMLEIVPTTYPEACRFISRHHRHHLPPQGWKFGVAAAENGRVVGVVTVGRPVARHLDDGWTLEVTRCCTDGTKNAASMLYAAAWRATRALGYRRLITYTLIEEPGTSLKAAGWKVIGTTAGGSWNCPSRPRVDKAPLGSKTLWEAQV
jgi:hypothetical protein